MIFEPITLDRQKGYRQRLSACRQLASDYSFVNLWSWSAHYGLEWAWEDHLIWFRQAGSRRCYWAPVGDWQAVDWLEQFEQFVPPGAVFLRVPEALCRIWEKSLKGKISIEESRDDWDYLYSREALVELKGNRFHKKRNLLRQFEKKYRFERRPLSGKEIQAAIDMQETWCAWRDCESSDLLTAENGAISTVLENWNRLEGICGECLLVDGEIVAYTVAESFSEDTLLIHFEKGRPDIKGVYQAINQMFLSSRSGFSLVNREQDLGDAGMRKSKLSYHPVDFVKKYRVVC
jgi:hypothetical protein